MMKLIEEIEAVKDKQLKKKIEIVGKSVSCIDSLGDFFGIKFRDESFIIFEMEIHTDDGDYCIIDEISDFRFKDKDFLRIINKIHVITDMDFDRQWRLNKFTKEQDKKQADLEKIKELREKYPEEFA